MCETLNYMGPFTNFFPTGNIIMTSTYEPPRHEIFHCLHAACTKKYLSNDSTWLVVYFLLPTSVPVYGRLHGFNNLPHSIWNSVAASDPLPPPPHPSITTMQCVEKNICERLLMCANTHNYCKDDLPSLSGWTTNTEVSAEEKQHFTVISNQT